MRDRLGQLGCRRADGRPAATQQHPEGQDGEHAEQNERHADAPPGGFAFRRDGPVPGGLAALDMGRLHAGARFDRANRVGSAAEDAPQPAGA